jgi:hypothetical protein
MGGITARRFASIWAIRASVKLSSLSSPSAVGVVGEAVHHQHGVAVGGASLLGGGSRTAGAHALEGVSRPAVLIKAR